MTAEPLPLEAWGLEGAEVTPWTGGTANHNYRVVQDERVYFLRQRSPRYIDPAQIAFDHALMRHLARCGVRGPNPILTVSGESVVHVRESVYELHPFLEGEPVIWEELEHLRMAAKALRKFHEATATFAAPAPKNWPRDDAPTSILAGLAELREVIVDPGQLVVLDELGEWARRIQEALPDEAYWRLPCQVIHGDFHPGNVNVHGDDIGIFDLDCASRQPRVRDLADAVLYFCARRDGPFDASTIVRLTRECWLEPGRNSVFVESYGEISDEERAALPWLVAARWIFSRVNGRRKLPREAWPAYATDGVLTPLRGILDFQFLI